MKNITASMPSELRRIIELFDKSAVEYLLFKCEHILAGENKNLDILLKTPGDYNRASEILEQQEYVLYMDEKVEKYKKMYVFFEGKILSAIHLHREIAWHGVIVLDKEKIFGRATGAIPSPEDSLLIHAAHALFENFKVKEKYKPLLEKYKQQTKNWGYIDSQLSLFGWEKPFYTFIAHFSVNPYSIMRAYASCLWKNQGNVLNLFFKTLKVGKRKISLTRKGYLISLIGINGSGKSTTKTSLLEHYLPLTNFASGQQGYYFGWKESFLGKMVSKLNHGGNKKLFDLVSEEKVKSFDVFQELLFCYIYCSLLFRYGKEIYPHLRKNELVVTDRYFYDLYGQYPYSQKSRILRLLPIPKPNRLVVLDASIEAVLKRDKGGTAARIVQPREKLEGQRKRYLAIGERNNALIINADDKFSENIFKIINNTWREHAACK